jgi:DNA (cytosine-5)-methyltransferase 3A
MKVVSFFDGMGCAYLALKEIGVSIKSYHAYEIDKHAMKAAKALNPNVTHKGDVRFFDVKDYPDGIDLFAGGSPCTDLSFAGKMSGLICNSLGEYMELRAEYLKTKDENLFFHNGKFQQSILFWEWLRALKEIQKVNPGVYFLLENVIMPKQHENTISKELGIAPIRINANLVSAQNRDRLFWTNISLEPFGLFGDMECTIPQPKDRGILLKHILESDVKEKYYLSDKMLNYFSSRAKNFNNGKVNIRDENGKSSRIKTSSKSIDISDNFIKVNTDLSVSDNQEKANCFTAGGNSGGLHSDMTLIKEFPVCVASRGRNPENPKSREIGLNTEQQLEPRFDGKTNCLTSVQKDNLVMTKNYLQWDVSGKGYKSQQDRAFFENGKHGTLSASDGQNKTGVIVFRFDQYQFHRVSFTYFHTVAFLVLVFSLIVSVPLGLVPIYQIHQLLYS